ncbi:MAG: hypothetical protein WBF76_02725, partial [Pseudonocardiaceae bacterium]
MTTTYTLPTSAPERQTTMVSNCHVVLGWFQLEQSDIVAGVAGADFFQVVSWVLPVPSSFIPYQPCFLPLRRSTLVADLKLTEQPRTVTNKQSTEATTAVGRWNDQATGS